MTAALVVKRPMEIEAISNDRLFEMRRHDWDMLKRMINRVPNQSKLISSFYSLLFGIGLTSLSILLTTTNMNEWAYIILISVTISTLFLGVVLIIVDRKTSRTNKELIDQINTEILEIEKLCKQSYPENVQTK